MRFLFRALIGAGVSLASMGVCQASIVGGSFAFSASGFDPGAPVTTVFGSFTIRFENSTDVVDTSLGLQNFMINIPFSGEAEYRYFTSLDLLIIGGSAIDASTVDTTQDFVLGIGNFSTDPRIQVLFFSGVTPGDFGSFGPFTLASVTASVPEPASVALLVASLAFLPITPSVSGRRLRRPEQVTTKQPHARENLTS